MPVVAPSRPLPAPRRRPALLARTNTIERRRGGSATDDTDRALPSGGKERRGRTCGLRRGLAPPPPPRSLAVRRMWGKGEERCRFSSLLTCHLPPTPTQRSGARVRGRCGLDCLEAIALPLYVRIALHSSNESRHGWSVGRSSDKAVSVGDCGFKTESCGFEVICKRSFEMELTLRWSRPPRTDAINPGPELVRLVRAVAAAPAPQKLAHASSWPPRASTGAQGPGHSRRGAGACGRDRRGAGAR